MSDHLLVFTDQTLATQVAEELRGDGFEDVRVLEQATADGTTGTGVLVREPTVVDESRPVEQGLRDRFSALADEHGAAYDPQPDVPTEG